MKVIARRITEGPQMEGHHEDLGLCYVSRFTFYPYEYLTVIPKDKADKEGVKARFDNDRATLLSKGLYLEEPK